MTSNQPEAGTPLEVAATNAIPAYKRWKTHGRIAGDDSLLYEFSKLATPEGVLTVLRALTAANAKWDKCVPLMNDLSQQVDDWAKHARIVEAKLGEAEKQIKLRDHDRIFLQSKINEREETIADLKNEPPPSLPRSRGWSRMLNGIGGCGISRRLIVSQRLQPA